MGFRGSRVQIPPLRHETAFTASIESSNSLTTSSVPLHTFAHSDCLSASFSVLAKLHVISDLGMCLPRSSFNSTMIRILRALISRAELQRVADESFADFVKAVVDLERGLLAIGGELHADEEATLLHDGSKQPNLWGINLYPSLEGSDMIEFDSMINIRPSQGNRSRLVEDEVVRKKIIDLVAKLVVE